MYAMQAEIEDRLLARFLADLVDFLLGLADAFFDSRRVNAAILDERADRDACDLAAYRVEARNRDRLGGVIDDHVDAGRGFERSDVTAFAADEATFEIIGR